MYNVQLIESRFPAQRDTDYRERTIEGVLREQAARRGGGLALRELLADGSVGREWTYAAILADAERMGRALASRHQAGARIAIFAGNCPEWVLVQLGAALAGLTLVTVNPSFLAREVRYVLEQSGAEAVYYQPHVRARRSALPPRKRPRASTPSGILSISRIARRCLMARMRANCARPSQTISS